MPLARPRPEDARFLQLALAEAKAGFDAGGLPVGSVLVRDGKVLGAGRNRFVQDGDPTAHAEIDCLRNAGRQPGYAGATLYTTLSPCAMCAGAALFLGIPRVVIGDVRSYPGDPAFLAERGVEVVVADDADCMALMARFTTERASLWQEVTAGDEAS
jgi:cytosine deaminase